MKTINRRSFLINTGRAVGALALGGVAYRVAGEHLSKAENAKVGPRSRFVWQIDPEKCTHCGLCEVNCVRTPSAVKAVNDQKKCSNCVVCHGHIEETGVPSEKIDSEGIRICPYDAITRTNHSGGKDGFFLYKIDEEKCVGCGKCVKLCNTKGTKSMFLLIRPDLCLNCNSCDIAEKCPSHAIDRLYIGDEDDFRGDYQSEGGGDMMMG